MNIFVEIRRKFYLNILSFFLLHIFKVNIKKDNINSKAFDISYLLGKSLFLIAESEQWNDSYKNFTQLKEQVIQFKESSKEISKSYKTLQNKFLLKDKNFKEIQNKVLLKICNDIQNFAIIPEIVKYLQNKENNDFFFNIIEKIKIILQFHLYDNLLGNQQHIIDFIQNSLLKFKPILLEDDSKSKLNNFNFNIENIFLNELKFIQSLVDDLKLICVPFIGSLIDNTNIANDFDVPFFGGLKKSIADNKNDNNFKPRFLMFFFKILHSQRILNVNEYNKCSKQNQDLNLIYEISNQCEHLLFCNKTKFDSYIDAAINLALNESNDFFSYDIKKLIYFVFRKHNNQHRKSNYKILSEMLSYSVDKQLKEIIFKKINNEEINNIINQVFDIVMNFARTDATREDLYVKYLCLREHYALITQVRTYLINLINNQDIINKKGLDFALYDCVLIISYYSYLLCVPFFKNILTKMISDIDSIDDIFWPYWSVDEYKVKEAKKYFYFILNTYLKQVEKDMELYVLFSNQSFWSWFHKIFFSCVFPDILSFCNLNLVENKNSKMIDIIDKEEMFKKISSKSNILTQFISQVVTSSEDINKIKQSKENKIMLLKENLHKNNINFKRILNLTFIKEYFNPINLYPTGFEFLEDLQNDLNSSIKSNDKLQKEMIENYLGFMFSSIQNWPNKYKKVGNFKFRKFFDDMLIIYRKKFYEENLKILKLQKDISICTLKIHKIKNELRLLMSNLYSKID